MLLCRALPSWDLRAGKRKVHRNRDSSTSKTLSRKIHRNCLHPNIPPCPTHGTQHCMLYDYTGTQTSAWAVRPVQPSHLRRVVKQSQRRHGLREKGRKKVRVQAQTGSQQTCQPYPQVVHSVEVGQHGVLPPAHINVGRVEGRTSRKCANSTHHVEYFIATVARAANRAYHLSEKHRVHAAKVLQRRVRDGYDCRVCCEKVGEQDNIPWNELLRWPLIGSPQSFACIFAVWLDFSKHVVSLLLPNKKTRKQRNILHIYTPKKITYTSIHACVFDIT